MVDRKKFYDGIRPYFGGKLSKEQVHGMEEIIRTAEARKWDLRWLAAALGTALIEVGPNMQPVSENLNYSAQGLADTFPSTCSVNPKARIKVPNAKAKAIARNPEQIANYVYATKNGNVSAGDGWKFRGRGYPQTTGLRNYAKLEAAAKSAGHDWSLVENPDLLLQIEPAVFALVEGMERGLYTGKKLADYFTTSKNNWAASRAIINGQFKAAEYEIHCLAFYKALT